MTHYVVRAHGMLTTPRMLKERLGARSTKIQTTPTRFVWRRDFFMAYPNVETVVLNALISQHNYQRLQDFYISRKSVQMVMIHEGGVKTPLSYPNDQVVVRPHRHFGGANFQVMSSSAFPSNRSHLHENMRQNTFEHYAVPLFEKQYEYRMLYVRGKLIATLRKMVDEGTSPRVPWNHAQGSSFTQVAWDTCRLRFTSVRTDLESHHIIQNADIVGVDVMIKRPTTTVLSSPQPQWEYAVCEYNFSPSLSIEPVIEKIIARIRETEITN